MHKKLLLTLIPMLILCSCESKPRQWLEDGYFTMGSFASVQVYAKDESILADINSTILEVESEISKNIETSSVHRLNSGEADIILAAHSTKVLELAQRYHTETNGSYSYALGSLIDLWDIKSGNQIIPEQDAITKTLETCLTDNLTINDGSYTLSGGTQIDLGAIGKGYATDVIHSLLTEKKISDALINLGGSSILAVGDNDGNGWKMALQDIDMQEGKFFGSLTLENQFAAVSAVYNQGFMQDEVRYHHILDPDTGYPTQSGISQVIVVADSGAMADAYSTAMLVMGEQLAKEFYARQNNFEFIIVTDDKKVIVSHGLDLQFEKDKSAIDYSFTTY